MKTGVYAIFNKAILVINYENEFYIYIMLNDNCGLTLQYNSFNHHYDMLFCSTTVELQGLEH